MDTESHIYIAIDFDGTIVKHRFPSIGELLPHAIRVIGKLKNVPTVRLILLTMRSDTTEGDYLTDAIEFCKQNGVEFWVVNENPDQDTWTSSRKVYSHYLIDDTAVGVPLNQSGDERPWVDWLEVEKYFNQVFGDNFGEPLTKALPVRSKAAFTKKPTTGFETQSHGGYTRTNNATGETHFVAPKKFPNGYNENAVIHNGSLSKYEKKYGALNLDILPPDDMPCRDIVENINGDHNTHWLLKWQEDDKTHYAATPEYKKILESPNFYAVQKYLLEWRDHLQSITQRIRQPQSERDFVEALYELFISQNYLSEELKNVRVQDITVGKRSWKIGDRTLNMTQEVFDYADKLLYLKDPMDLLFSYKKENEPFHKVEGWEYLRLCMMSNKFKLLYGCLVELHRQNLMGGIVKNTAAVSFMIAATQCIAEHFKQDVKEFWSSIPFDAIKQYLFSNNSQGKNHPSLQTIERVCREIVTGTILFPTHLEIAQSPHDKKFSETFFGKKNYAHMPSLS